MKHRNRAKLGLLALLILGGELIALLVLLLSGPVSAAFAPDNAADSHANGGGSGTTFHSTQGNGNSGHSQQSQAQGGQSADRFILCLVQPSFCEDQEGSAWPNNFDLGPWGHAGGSIPPASQYYAHDTGSPWSGAGFFNGGLGNPGIGGSPSNQFASNNSDDTDQPGTPGTNDTNNPNPNGSENIDDAGNDPGTKSIDKPGVTDEPGHEPKPDPDLPLVVDNGDPGETDGGPTGKNPPTLDDFTPPTLVVETPAETLDVPEPLSLSLFASGVAGILAARHRRKSRKNAA